MSAVSLSSSSRPRGAWRCAERCWPSAAQTRRSETGKTRRTCSTQARRRAGPRSFPARPPPGSACPGSGPPPPGAGARCKLGAEYAKSTDTALTSGHGSILFAENFNACLFYATTIIFTEIGNQEVVLGTVKFTLLRMDCEYLFCQYVKICPLENGLCLIQRQLTSP
jgi:hypothetical protein